MWDPTQPPKDFLGPWKLAVWASTRIVALAILVWTALLVPILAAFKIADWIARVRRRRGRERGGEDRD